MKIRSGFVSNSSSSSFVLAGYPMDQDRFIDLFYSVFSDNEICGKIESLNKADKIGEMTEFIENNTELDVYILDNDDVCVCEVLDRWSDDSYIDLSYHDISNTKIIIDETFNHKLDDLKFVIVSGTEGC